MEISANMRFALAVIAGIATLSTSILVGQLYKNIMYPLAKRGRPPTKRPRKTWAIFWISALVSVVAGAIVAVVPVREDEAGGQNELLEQVVSDISRIRDVVESSDDGDTEFIEPTLTAVPVLSDRIDMTDEAMATSSARVTEAASVPASSEDSTPQPTRLSEAIDAIFVFDQSRGVRETMSYSASYTETYTETYTIEDALIESVQSFVDAIFEYSDESRVGIVAFSNEASLELPLNGDPEIVTDYTRSSLWTGDNSYYSNIIAGLELAYHYLSDGRREGVSQMIFLFTDGYGNMGEFDGGFDGFEEEAISSREADTYDLVARIQADEMKVIGVQIEYYYHDTPILFYTTDVYFEVPPPILSVSIEELLD